LQKIGYNATKKGKQMTEKDNRCENCEYSKPAKGLGVVVLTCDQKDRENRLIVEAGDRCDKFMRARELVPPDLAAALAEGAKLIPLTQDKFTIVDAEDYDQLSKHKWHVSKNRRTEYAARGSGPKNIKMHRLLLNAPPHLLGDQRDRNGLNNRKANLRLCTNKENTRNARPNLKGSSRFKGVSWHKKTKKYNATIQKNGKRYSLGCYHDEIEAAVVYDIKAMELFGQFAYFNFPKLMQRYKLVNSIT
jgi:hypothetical protein